MAPLPLLVAYAFSYRTHSAQVDPLFNIRGRSKLRSDHTPAWYESNFFYSHYILFGVFLIVIALDRTKVGGSGGMTTFTPTRGEKKNL